MKQFSAEDYLETPKDIVQYLESVIEDYSDVSEIVAALRIVVRSRGFTQIAREGNVNRENLYTALARNGNPTLRTVAAVLKPLGIRLAFQVDSKGAGSAAV